VVAVDIGSRNGAKNGTSRVSRTFTRRVAEPDEELEQGAK
jgi:hypothetical protein